MYHARNPDIPDNKQLMSSAGRVLQPAGYNAIHARRPPAEQEATSHVCGSLVALYCCRLVFHRTLRSANLEASAVARYITGTTTLLMQQCDFRRQPSVVESSNTFFGASLSITTTTASASAVNVNIVPPLYCSVCRVCRVSRVCVRCVPCVTRAVPSILSDFQTIFFMDNSRFCVRERPSSP